MRYGPLVCIGGKNGQRFSGMVTQSFKDFHHGINIGTGVSFGHIAFVEFNYFRNILSKTGENFGNTTPRFYDSYIGGTLGIYLWSFYK